MVVLLLERFIFPVLYSNMSKRNLRGADVYPWISNSNLFQAGHDWPGIVQMPLYSAASISPERACNSWRDVWCCCLHFNNMFGSTRSDKLHGNQAVVAPLHQYTNFKKHGSYIFTFFSFLNMCEWTATVCMCKWSSPVDREPWTSATLFSSPCCLLI